MKKFMAGLLLLALIVSIPMLPAIHAAEKTKLTWWGWFPTSEDFQALKQRFEAKNPDIELECTYADIAPYMNKLKTELASGGGPDIMSMQEGALLNQVKPYLLDLKPQLGAWSKQIVPSALKEAQTVSGDKKLFLLPLGMSAQMFLFYNATLLEQAGVKPPTTFNELVAACQTLKKKYPDKIPFTIGLQDQWFASDLFILMSNMVSPGITTKADQGKVKWNSKPFVKAMNILKDLVAKGIISKDSVGLPTYEGAIGLFLDRKALLFANGSWNAGNLSLKYGERRRGRATDNDIMGALPMPNFAGGKPVVVGGIDVGLSVNKNTKNKEAAMKLVEFMTVGDGQQYFVGTAGGNGVGLIPAKVGLKKDTAIWPDTIAQQSVKSMSDAYNSSLAASREINNPEIKSQLAVEIQNIITGKDVKKALDDIQKVAERE